MTFWVSRIYLTWPFSTLWRFKSTLWLYKQNIFWNLTTPSHPVSTDPLTTDPSPTQIHPSYLLTFWVSHSCTTSSCHFRCLLVFLPWALLGSVHQCRPGVDSLHVWRMCSADTGATRQEQSKTIGLWRTAGELAGAWTDTSRWWIQYRFIFVLVSVWRDTSRW